MSFTTQEFSKNRINKSVQNVPVYRYDHLSVLCELMPVALPSLASCLQTLCLGHFNTEAQTAVTVRLGISSVEVEEIGRWDPTQNHHAKTCVCASRSQSNGFLFHAALQVFCRWFTFPGKEAGWADRGTQYIAELWRHPVLWKWHVSCGLWSHQHLGHHRPPVWHSSRCN